jgi:hypothetical protein
MTLLPPERKVPPKTPQVRTPPPSKPARQAKTFTTSKWVGENEGEKIIVYADSGMGKTTLASLLPKPVFIGLDDGGRKIQGRVLEHIPDVETFDDLRDALHQTNLYDNYDSLVIDTLTRVDEGLVLPWVFENVLAGEKGSTYKAVNIEQYGWGKGYRHTYDAMRILLADLDVLVRMGKNVVLLCQSATESVPNPGGEDFLRDAPKLQFQHGKTPSVSGLFVEWVDHVFRIGYSDITTAKKKASSSGERVIFVHPQIHFVAKSRTVPAEFPVVTFSDTTDDSIWQFVFDKAWERSG